MNANGPELFEQYKEQEDKINSLEQKFGDKQKYKEVKKYYNKGIFSFSFYITLRKFPYFTIFNNYNTKYPRFI